MNTASIPLADLEPDEAINARRTKSDEGIAELKASVLAHGLIQALRVRHDKATGKLKVIAGHRRYRVLCELATDGDVIDGIPVNDEYLVPVIFGDVDDAMARELSQAENFIRLPQDEADTLETFRDLADRGLDEVQIASRFGIDPKRVKRMLAIGRLHPCILEWWRGQDSTAETINTVRAFTLAPSIEDQEKLFKKLGKQGDIRSWSVKRALGADNHEAARAIKIAGLDAYKAAGGRYTQDLFGDNHVIQNPEIAEQVANDKIDTTLEGLKNEGWLWVSTAGELPYSWTYAWSKEQPTDGKATTDEKKRIKKLEKAAAKGTDGAADGLADLQKEIADRQWTPEQLASAGAVLEIGHHGDLKITRGVVKPEAPKKEKAAGEKSEKAPTISNAMHDRLSIQATLALRQALQQDPRLGFVALLAGFTVHRHLHTDSPVRVYHDGFGKKYSSEQESFASVFGRLSSMTDTDLFVVAAGCAAEAVHIERPYVGKSPFDSNSSPLAAAIDADRLAAALHEHFDAIDYFNGVAKPFIIDAIREAVNEDEARKAEKLKKKDLVEFAVKNVQGTSWLPPELRAPTYSGPGDVPRLEVSPPPLDDDSDFDEIDEDEDLDEIA